LQFRKDKDKINLEDCTKTVIKDLVNNRPYIH